MVLRSRAKRLIGWLVPLGWLAAAGLLGVWFIVPVLRRDARGFAWGTAVCAVIGALGYIARLRSLRATQSLATPSERHLSPRTRRRSGRAVLPRPRERSHGYGHSHSVEKPRFD